MKRIISLLLLVLILSFTLMSCGIDVPQPKVQEGRFNFSVTYEVGGVEKTIEGVYVCKFVKAYAGLTGHNRVWEGYIEGSDIEDVERYELLSNKDGIIYLDLALDPMYFMADPFYDSFNDSEKPEAYAFIVYHDDIAEEMGYFDTDPEILERYGVRVLSFEYDEPIENTYE